MTRDIQPIFILPEGTQKTSGRTAQKLNIEAAKLVAEQVRTTLGPKGMDKMIVDSMGEITITNDGVTILDQMAIEHPTAKMIVEIARTQDNEVGDGTTTAVIYAGELLKNAEGMLDQNIHPTMIIKGYLLASKKAMQILNDLSEPVSEHDTELLKHIAGTAMTGKSAESAKELLSNMLVKSILKIAENEDGKTIYDTANIKIEKKVGSGIEDTELIEGVMLDKERVHPGMPKRIQNAKIALIDCPIEVKDTETDAKISITDPNQMQAFLDQEERMIKEKVDKILSTGATVIFCQKGIDDLAQFFFSKAGVYACRRVARDDMKKLSKATNAAIISNLKEISQADIGSAGLVEEVKVGDENMTSIRQCPNPKAVTILVRGGTDHVAEETKRAIDDALGDLAAALHGKKVVAGAGSIEIALAKQLRDYSQSLSGKEQIAVQAFAEAIEVIPRTLAESAGLDIIDKIAEMRAAHNQGMKWAGINVFTGNVMDAWQNNVVEPLKVKTQALKSASEVAIMILRIDDVISGGGSQRDMTPGGPGGGFGGMPPMM